ncbi:MAG: LuxR C-terminal-related transcriptional regulator, partial [Nitrospirota bacterium]
ELLGKFCFDVFTGRDPEGNRFCFEGCSVMKMAKQNKPAHNFDLHLTTRSGKDTWVNVATLLESRPVGPSGPNIVHLFRISPSSGARGEPNEAPNGHNIAIVMRKYALSRREAEVLSLMTQSLVAKEIGVRLKLSTATVRTHIQNILKKLRVHSKLEAVALVLRQKR